MSSKHREEKGGCKGGQEGVKKINKTLGCHSAWMFFLISIGKAAARLFVISVNVHAQGAA